jgi:acyl carrier protein
MNETNQIAQELIDLIINSVHLHHLKKEDIGLNTPLTQGGLNLDSIDILEVVVAVEHKFGVKVADAEMGKKYFKSIGTVTEFIQSHKSSGPSSH